MYRHFFVFACFAFLFFESQVNAQEFTERSSQEYQDYIDEQEGEEKARNYNFAAQAALHTLHGDIKLRDSGIQRDLDIPIDSITVLLQNQTDAQFSFLPHKMRFNLGLYKSISHSAGESEERYYDLYLNNQQGRLDATASNHAKIDVQGLQFSTSYFLFSTEQEGFHFLWSLNAKWQRLKYNLNENTFQFTSFEGSPEVSSYNRGLDYKMTEFHLATGPRFLFSLGSYSWQAGFFVSPLNSYSDTEKRRTLPVRIPVSASADYKNATSYEGLFQMNYKLTRTWKVAAQFEHRKSKLGSSKGKRNFEYSDGSRVSSPSSLEMQVQTISLLTEYFF